MNVPKLRFKEFEAEWFNCSVGEIISNKSKKYDPLKNTVDYPCLELEHLSQETGEILGSSSARGQKSIKNYFNAHDVLYGKLRPYLKKFAQPKFQGVCSSEIWVLSSKYIAHDYLFQYIQTDNFFALTEIQSGSKMPRADWDSVSKGELNYPTKDEQTKIASFLTALDEKIAQLTQKHGLLSQYKKGVMQQIFSQQLRFKDDNGEEFGEWVNCSLESCASFYRGGALSKADLDENGIYECIHYGELFTSYSELIHHVKSRTNINGLIKSKYGDILMPSSDVTPSGLAKASSLLKEDIIIGGDINIIRPNELIFSHFLSYLLNFEKNKIIQLVSGTTVKHIYIKDIKTIELSIPSSLSEQTKIANFLSSIDQKIDQVAAQLDAAKQYKRGLLQQMFV